MTENAPPADVESDEEEDVPGERGVRDEERAHIRDDAALAGARRERDEGRRGLRSCGGVCLPPRPRRHGVRRVPRPLAPRGAARLR